MTNQWPQPRSLKDDPPQGFNDILIADHTGWKLIGSSSETKFFLESGYTHWLPAPPAPPEPKETWKVKWESKAPCLCYCPNAPEREIFKAGWNAALEEFGKQYGGPKTPLSIIDDLKAP